MIEHAEVRRYLPTRPPMLLIDRVLEIEPWRRVVAVKVVSAAELCYWNLADGLPSSAFRYPASLTLESLAEAGVLLWRYSAAPSDGRPSGQLLLGSVLDYVIYGAALPGDTMRHEAMIDRVLDDETLLLSGKTFVGSELIAEVGTLIGAVRQLPSGTDSLPITLME